MSETGRDSLLRDAGDGAAVTTVELFFDLVFVFAVTQLSSLIGADTTWDGAVQAAVLLAMMWQIWIYTTWCTNYIDPRAQSVRLLLLSLMGTSLVFAAALEHAFTDRGALVAAMYIAMQVGRTLFMLWALRGEHLVPTFQRILPWTTFTSCIVVVGTFEHGHVREALWASAVAIDLIAAAFGFYIPGLGRSATSDWTVVGGHFAERCQAFVLIALGESIVVTGERLSGQSLHGGVVTAFLVVFAGSIGLWWLYFDRAAEDSADVISSSDDPGKLARNAFHWIHPVIIGGIIVTAAADERVLTAHAARADRPTAWLVLGGTALFLAGHALFKAVVWQVIPVTRLIGAALLLAALLVATRMSTLTVGAIALAVIVAVAVSDRLLHPVRHRAAG